MRSWRFPAAVASALFFLSVLLAAFLAIDDRSVLERPPEITPDSIERATRTLEENDPRGVAPGTVRRLTILQQDLDLAADYIAHQFARGGARIMLSAGRISIEASVTLPENPLGRFVNIRAVLTGDGGPPVFDRLRVGRLPVPVWLANRLLARVLAEFGITRDVVRGIDIGGDRLVVSYSWQPHLPDKLRSALLSGEEQRRLRAYQDRLAELTRASPPRPVAAVDLLVPLFQLAHERSRAAEPIAENRAALLVLAMYANDRPLQEIAPAARRWRRPVPREVRLAGRADLAKHFLVSGALAASAGTPLADAVGLYKELGDSRGGSGFSFYDLAADRAGARFGERAADSATARALQRRLSAGVLEGDLMPEAGDLPEFLPEAEFKRRFGGVGDPRYETMMAEIERRIANLALYR
ncbi:MAG TPA: hypothetical protein VNN77_07550 [candidate division Zixibacteria bacterium]|nr:hypothetical protein [candidate division Zixibacteria bacterium]